MLDTAARRATEAAGPGSHCPPANSLAARTRPHGPPRPGKHPGNPQPMMAPCWHCLPSRVCVDSPLAGARLRPAPALTSRTDQCQDRAPGQTSDGDPRTPFLEAQTAAQASCGHCPGLDGTVGAIGRIHERITGRAGG